MMQSVQRVGLVLGLGVAMVALILLSAGLSDVELTTTWRNFFAEETETEGDESNTLGGPPVLIDDVPGTIFQVVGLSVFLSIPLIILLMVISPEMRRAIMRDLRRALIFVSIVVVFFLLRDTFKQLMSGEMSFGEPTTGLPAVPDFIERPSPMLVFGIGVLSLSLLVGIGWTVWRRLHLQKNPLAWLALDAQEAIADLQAGAEFRNTIIQHYASMCRILAEEKNVKRAQAMTPSEFAQKLEELGLAGEEAKRLTNLFERVRYGTQDLSEADEQEAMACLTIVAQAASRENEK